MFRRLDDFLQGYSKLSQGTQQLLDILSDADLTRAVAEGHRTLGGLAWHIVVSAVEMMNRTGLGLATIDAQAPPPASARDIALAYRRVAQELPQALQRQWTDETLQVADDMYGESWPRGLTLAILREHEVHHRAQMTVLMRQAGLRVPGLLGPSREEWAQYGMEAPSY
jgi:uncharacterized damage-inducible protein DinB